VERLEITYERNDTTNESERREEWRRVLTEEKFTDFYLIDPAAPQMSMYVPADKFPVKRYTELNDMTGQESTPSWSLWNSGNTPEMMELCQRHAVTLNFSHGVRAAEKSYDIGEQIGALGVVREAQTTQFQPVRQLEPLEENLLDEKYFETNQWDSWDQLAWKELTEHKAILCSDSQEFAQGCVIAPTV